MTASLKERFYSKVSVSDGCWEWIGSINGCGYGSIKHQGKTLGSHRVSYELHKGEIPAGMHVMHKCDNPSCVNPDHLLIGTHADNMRDMYLKNRRIPATGLKNGAAKLSPDNISLLLTSNEPSEKLAKQLGVSGSRIRAIRRSHLN